MDWQLAKAIMKLHREYNINRPQPNYYLTFLELIEEEAPDISGDLEQSFFRCDDTDYQGEEQEHAARLHALQLIENWKTALERLEERIKG